jgi:hypothetical protein
MSPVKSVTIDIYAVAVKIEQGNKQIKWWW